MSEPNNKIENKSKLDSKLIISVLIGGFVVLILSFLAPILFTQFSWVDFTETGQIGDTIGGIMNPFISIVAVFVTFLAFYAQYQANIELGSQLIEQKKQFEVTQIENQFYEMLRLHKDNLRGLILRVEKNHELPDLSDSDALSIILNEINLAIEISTSLSSDFFIDFNLNQAYSAVFHGYVSIEKDKTRFNSKIHHSINFGFYPTYFKGYSSEFSRYYRHLFQTVKFIANKDEEIISYERKRSYLRLLRAQLTNEEQLLLFYNWYSGYGKQWENETNKFFTDYRMIHNIPSTLVSEFIDIKTIFEKSLFKEEKERKGKDPLFEFQDIDPNFVEI